MSKQIITAVVAMNQARVIGVDNQLPWHIPEDLHYFKSVTIDKPIIMGRKTFQSIGRALPRRRNIVITTQADFHYDNIEIYGSIDEALKSLTNEPEVCIIGGGTIFEQTIGIINSLHLTEVALEVANPCAWFPMLDLSKWDLKSSSEIISNSAIKCKFMHYVKNIL